MSVFNDNVRFLTKKMGLSQQNLADMMGFKRGKVSGYFYSTQAKPDFHSKFSKQFGINIGRFLTVPMNDSNYDSFLVGKNKSSKVSEDAEEYTIKSEFIDLLLKVKELSDPKEIAPIIDKALTVYGKVLDENIKLKDTNSQLKDQLIDLKEKKEGTK